MSRAYFITGTDTGVGKTSVAVALLQAAVKRGLSTAAVKPVAAGCELTREGLRNDDALFFKQACTIALTYEQIYLFACLLYTFPSPRHRNRYRMSSSDF